MRNYHGLPVTVTACIAIALTAIPTVAQSSTNALADAVAFALTGSDGADVRVIDRADCVFIINPKTEDGHVVGEAFYLNNVLVDRLVVQPWQNAVGRWAEVSLHGVMPVYAYSGAYDIDTTNSAIPREQQEALRAIFRPRRAASFTLKIYTTEYDRLVRAWRYIYSHGCKGSRSSF